MSLRTRSLLQVTSPPGLTLRSTPFASLTGLGQAALALAG